MNWLIDTCLGSWLCSVSQTEGEGELAYSLEEENIKVLIQCVHVMLGVYVIHVYVHKCQCICFVYIGKCILLYVWVHFICICYVILEPPKIKSNTVSTVSHLFPVKWRDRMPWSSFSECWALSQLFNSPLSLSSRGFLVPLHFLP